MKSHRHDTKNWMPEEQGHEPHRVSRASFLSSSTVKGASAVGKRGERRRLGAALVAILFVAAWNTPAFALPDDRVVHYAIHTNPTNPTSPVQYFLSLSISAQSQDGDDIGWQVDTYTVTEKATMGSDTAWEIDLPDVDSSDGLWWVTHVDPDIPDRSDFVDIAPVVGTALALDPTDDDLEIDVSPGTYTEPAGGDPWEVTTAVTFEFTVAGEPTPGDGGTDEPVDMPIPPIEPTSSNQ